MIFVSNPEKDFATAGKYRSHTDVITIVFNRYDKEKSIKQIE